MRTELKVLVVALVIFNFACTAAVAAGTGGRWQIGTPIVTYYNGPTLDDRVAKQMAEGGFNLVWSGEKELDIAQRHGLRALLNDVLLTSFYWSFPEHPLDNPDKRKKIDALIERVKHHPAMYAYYINDEPKAAWFPALGRLVAYLRERDPAHPAYINLFPTYASNEQLGTSGDTITAYREHLRLFIEQVKPDILSYDHYHFTTSGTDGDQYFLNLSMIRQAALDAGIPFMNTVQACSWNPGMRVPNGNEMCWLNYTSLAYGAQALSYFVYLGFTGGMTLPDGSTTPQYAAARELSPQFIAVASQVRPLRSLGAYHAGKQYWGAVALPENAPFFLDFSGEGMSQMPAEGMLLGYFGRAGGSGKSTGPTHVLVVNLNYKSAVTTTVVGPSRLYLFDAVALKWTLATDSRVAVTLPPGGGKLIRRYRVRGNRRQHPTPRPPSSSFARRGRERLFRQPDVEV